VVKEGTLRMQATNCASGFEVTTDGTGVVGHAGAALLGELADRLGLTGTLGWRQAGGHRRHPDEVVLRDLAVMLADGGDCLSDLAALREQPELFGRVTSTPTAWRVLDQVARDAAGLARLRAAGARPRPRLGGRRRSAGRARSEVSHNRARSHGWLHRFRLDGSVGGGGGGCGPGGCPQQSRTRSGGGGG
jgi:hypothetical protein